MHIAAAHHPPTSRRHYPAGQRMKGVEDRLFARQNPRHVAVSPGTGKTHLAIAIARSCIRAGSRGRFYTTVDLVNQLEARPAGRQGRLADYLTAPRLRHP